MDAIADFHPDELIQAHMERVLASWSQDPGADWTRELINRLVTVELGSITTLATGYMQEAFKDGERHSVGIWQGDLHIRISTFPCSIEEAKQKYYSQGYYEYLNSALKVARAENASCHFVHFQFFWDGSKFWVQLTLFPNRNVLTFDLLYCLPLDVLTDTDHKILKQHGIKLRTKGEKRE